MLEDSMKFLVIGCSSIGERHIKNLTSLSAGEILAYDTDNNRLNLMKKKYNVNTYESIGKAWKQNPDVVCSLTPKHLKEFVEWKDKVEGER